MRARLVAALMQERDEAPHMRQLIREVGPGISFVRRELAELERMGLVHARRGGSAVFFDVDRGHPLYDPLRALVDAAMSMDEGHGPERRYVAMFYEPPHHRPL